MFSIQSIRSSFRFMHGNILVFSITALLGNFSRSMVFPYASLYILALGGSPEQIGFVNALAPLGGLILFPIAGYLADNTGRVRVIALANYLSSAVLLIFVLAQSWRWIAVAMLLRGVISLQFPARSALIADSLAPAERGKGVAAMNTIGGALSLFAPYIAGTIVAFYGPERGIRWLYTAMMILYLLSAAGGHYFLVETSSNAGKRLKVGELLRSIVDAYRGLGTLRRRLPRSMSALTGVLVLSFMANGVVSPFWVIYAVEEIGLSPQSWGLILLVETAVRNMIFIPAGFLVDRWGRTASLLSALILALVAIPLFIVVHGFWPILLIRVAVALVQALMIPASTALIADSVSREIRGSVMAAIGQGSVMLGAAGGGTGGPGTGYLITLPLVAALVAGGYLYAYDPILPWLFVLGTTLLSIVLTLLWIRDADFAER